MPQSFVPWIRSSVDRSNLVLLVRLRWVAIFGQLVAIWITHQLLSIPLPLVEMTAVLVFLAAVNLVAQQRSTAKAPVTAMLLTAQILIDVLALTLLLFLSGGATNPFIGLFVLQDIIAIVLLPAIKAGAILLVTFAAGLYLLGHGRPIEVPGRDLQGPSFADLLLVGDYLSFVVAALLAAWFFIGLRRNLAHRDSELAEVQRQIDEETTVLRIGLMASTAAHDLGTPLTNLAVILDDWADLGLPPDDELQRQAVLMQEAVATCRETISRMLLTAGTARLEAAGAQDAAEFARSVAEDWRHGFDLVVEDQRTRGCRIIADVLLRRALENLLDNAAEAGARRIRIQVQNAGLRVEIAVCDDGPGFPQALIASGPAVFQSGHPGQARGLGLFLVQSVLRRLNGELRLSNHEGGGGRAALLLPYIA